MKTNKLSCGLFMFHGTSWWRNLRDIPIFVERIFFVLKHGYSPVAQWDTFEWFIDVMREILTNYRYNRVGTSGVVEYRDDDSWSDENEEAYNKILDEMIELLDKMEERYYLSENIEDFKKIDYTEMYNKQNEAKDRFFELFSKYFYTFWD